MGDARFAHPLQRLRLAPSLAADACAFSDDDLVQALAATTSEPYLANVAATELMNRLRRKHAVLAVAGEGSCVLDAQGRVLYLNPAAQRRLPRADQSASVDFHALVHPRDDAWEDCPLRLALRLGARVHVDDDVFETAAGSAFRVSYSVAPILRGGEIDGFVLVFRDTTERRRALDSLERNELRLQEAARLARVGRWDWDIPRDMLVWTDEAFRALGVDPSSFGGTFDAFLALVPPQEREGLKAHFRDALAGGRDVSITHGILTPAGPRRVWTRGSFELAPDHTPLFAWGVHQDVTGLPP